MRGNDLVNFEICSYCPAELIALDPPREKLTAAQVSTGSLLWDASTSSTPEALFNLLQQDGHALPSCRHTALRLLQELPSVETGLGAAETKLLGAVHRPDATWFSVARGYGLERERPTIRWHEAGLPLANPASCDVPALSGFILDPFREPPDPPGRFDSAAFQKHRRTPDRWVGGTHLEANAVWRWDAKNCALIAPD